MFYDDELLSAGSGPLAEVWLAANREKKLQKSSVLKSEIPKFVEDIVSQGRKGSGKAPLALRFSAGLMYGVVVIYSRKARYLLDDCAEAHMKIKSVRPSVTLIRHRY
jgi:cohesin complex subunit SCC1